MRVRLALLSVFLGLCCVAYLGLGARGDLAFVLGLRGQKLAALLIVAVAIAVATVMFQTITGNRILTPSIMGFDALYLLLLSAMVWGLGAQAYLALSGPLLMVATVALLCGAALLLFTAVLRSGQGDLMRMILTGVVLSTLFHSVTSFFQRMIDPNEYAVVQADSFARFSQAELDLLGVATLLAAAALWAAWRMRFRLDVLALGRVASTSLGASPDQGRWRALLIISLLVSVSTALVGPVAFFGLLVSALTYLVVPSPRHGDLFVAAALIAAIILVGGQTAIERVFDLSTPLSVVVEFGGGLVFLTLLLRSVRK